MSSFLSSPNVFNDRRVSAPIPPGIRFDGPPGEGTDSRAGRLPADASPAWRAEPITDPNARRSAPAGWPVAPRIEGACSSLRCASTASRYRAATPSRSPSCGHSCVSRAANPRDGWSLRGETNLDTLEDLENLDPFSCPTYSRMSHGESMTDIVTRTLQRPGLFLLDEPHGTADFVVETTEG